MLAIPSPSVYQVSKYQDHPCIGSGFQLSSCPVLPASLPASFVPSIISPVIPSTSPRIYSNLPELPTRPSGATTLSPHHSLFAPASKAADPTTIYNVSPYRSVTILSDVSKSVLVLLWELASTFGKQTVMLTSLKYIISRVLGCACMSVPTCSLAYGAGFMVLVMEKLFPSWI